MYTIEQIKEKIVPLAKAHNLKSVYLIGSYARNEAREDSDIDLLYDKEGSDITTFLKECSLHLDINELFNVSVDLVDAVALQSPEYQQTLNIFIQNIERDKVKIYDRT